MSVIAILAVMYFVVPGDEPSENTIQYIGTGTKTSTIHVAIQAQPKGILFLGQVEITDDHPNVWKVIEAILQNNENIDDVQKDETGRIRKINEFDADHQRRWILLLNNMVVDRSVEELTLENNQTVTLSFENISP